MSDNAAIPDSQNTDASSPAGEPITLQFDLTESDMTSHYTNTSENTKEWTEFRKKYHRIVFAAMACTLGLVAVSIVHREGFEDVWSFMFGVFVCAIIFLWWLSFRYANALHPHGKARQIRDFVVGPQGRYNQGVQTLQIDSNGVTLKGKYYELMQKWSGIASVRETNDSIYITKIDASQFIIPKRVFNTSDEAKDFLARARGSLDASGYGDGRRIRAFLAERDVHCRGCKYNLHGVTTPNCPECGRELALDW